MDRRDIQKILSRLPGLQLFVPPPPSDRAIRRREKEELENEQKRLAIEEARRKSMPTQDVVQAPDPEGLKSRFMQENMARGVQPLTELEKIKLDGLKYLESTGNLDSSAMSILDSLKNRETQTEIRHEPVSFERALPDIPYEKRQLRGELPSQTLQMERLAEERARRLAPYGGEGSANIPWGDANIASSAMKRAQQKDMAYVNPNTGEISEEPREGFQYVSRSLATQIQANFAKEGRVAERAKEKKLSTEEFKIVTNAESGLSAIRDMISAMERDPTVYRKANVPGARALFANDDTVQRFIRAKMEASDVITRLRTGAALNREEQIFYGNLLSSFWPSHTVAMENINKVGSFYKIILDATTGGKETLRESGDIKPRGEKRPQETPEQRKARLARELLGD